VEPHFKWSEAGSSFFDLLRQQEPVRIGSFTAAEFFLYESQIASGGSIYKKIARFPLTTESPRAG